MVSFSCDRCQDVIKKPKVDNHFNACKTTSVSCVDCSASFGRQEVKSHTSCFTEAQKYSGEFRGALGQMVQTGTDGCSQQLKDTDGFCFTCDLKLNGAVHSVQHYSSKKHTKQLRMKKTAQAQARKFNNQAKADKGEKCDDQVHHSKKVEQEEKEQSRAEQANGEQPMDTARNANHTNVQNENTNGEKEKSKSENKNKKKEKRDRDHTQVQKTIKKLIKKQPEKKMEFDLLIKSLISKDVKVEEKKLKKRLKDWKNLDLKDGWVIYSAKS